MVSSLSPNSAKTNGGGATAPPVDSRVEGVDGHYNRITKQWEETGSNQYVVSSVQNGSTFPEEIGYVSPKSSFKDRLFKGFGKSSNKDILPTNNQSTNPLLRKSTESTNSTLVESTGGRSHH